MGSKHYPKNVDFGYAYENSLRSELQNVNNHIVVPAEIDGQPVSQGHYHFGVFVTDAAGNEEQAFLELHLEEGHDHDH